MVSVLADENSSIPLSDVSKDNIQSLKDNNTLIIVSAIKNVNKNLKFNISKKNLQLYDNNGKLDFIISSIAKKCGYFDLNENYNCSYIKPLISNNLIN